MMVLRAQERGLMMNQRMFLAVHEASHLIDGAIHGKRFNRAIIALPAMTAMTGLVDFGDRPEQGESSVPGVVITKPWQRLQEPSLSGHVAREPALRDEPLKPML